MSTLNVLSVAAYLRGGELAKVQTLQTVMVQRLTKLHEKVGGRSIKGPIKTNQINERAVVNWIANVQPGTADLKTLKKLERTAAARLKSGK